MLLSNDYYPALTREHVTLVTEPIERIEARGVRTRDGVLHELDVLVCATGFFVTDNPTLAHVHGRDGRSLADALSGDLTHYKGTTFPGFPNLFMLGGPNTALGHSSVIFMIESQLNYATAAIRVALKGRHSHRAQGTRRTTLDPRRAGETPLHGVGNRMFQLVPQR